MYILYNKNRICKYLTKIIIYLLIVCIFALSYVTSIKADMITSGEDIIHISKDINGKTYDAYYTKKIVNNNDSKNTTSIQFIKTDINGYYNSNNYHKMSINNTESGFIIYDFIKDRFVYIDTYTVDSIKDYVYIDFSFNMLCYKLNNKFDSKKNYNLNFIYSKGGLGETGRYTYYINYSATNKNVYNNDDYFGVIFESYNLSRLENCTCLYSTFDIPNYYNLEESCSSYKLPEQVLDKFTLYYKEDKGYLLITSMEDYTGCEYIDMVSAKMKFKEKTLFYIFYSQDGFTWKRINKSGNCYSDNYILTDMSYLYNTQDKLIAKIVECKQGTIIIGDEWENIEDSLNNSNLSMISEETEIHEESVQSNSLLLPIFGTIIGFVTRDTSVLYQSFKDYDSGDWDVSADYSIINIMNTLLNDVDMYMYTDDNGLIHTVKQISIKGFIKGIYQELQDINKRFGNINNNLKNLYENALDIRKYLTNINASVLSNNNNESIENIDKIIDALWLDKGVTGFDAVNQVVLKQTIESNELLTKIKNGIVIGNGISGFDAIVDTIDAFSDKVVGKGLDGLIDNAQDFLQDILADAVNPSTIMSFVTSGITTVTSTTLISNALDFGSEIKDGASYVNGYVEKIYSLDTGIASLIMLCPVIFVVNTIVRRHD